MAPGKAYREGLSLMQLAEMFPTEDSAREWFESRIWPSGRCCGHCGSLRTCEASHAKMPYWCSGLPLLLQRSNRHRARELQATPPQVGLRDLPRNHEPQERLKHEAPPRSRHQSEGGLGSCFTAFAKPWKPRQGSSVRRAPSKWTRHTSGARPATCTRTSASRSSRDAAPPARQPLSVRRTASPTA